MMASRVARIPHYTSPYLFSPRISPTLRFHPHQLPAFHVPLPQFQSSVPNYFRQGTQRGFSMWESPAWSRSSGHIHWQNFLKKCQKSHKWFSEKIKALLQTNFGLGLATIFAGSVSNVVYTQYTNRIREIKLQSALAMGAVPDIERKVNFVERLGATKAIESILKPHIDYEHYNMIVGNHGTGKTTLVRHVGHKLDGILYVSIRPNCASDKSFAEEMAKAFHWTSPTHFWLDRLLAYWGISTAATADDTRALLDRVFNEFHNQAKLFKIKNGRTPVLVLDNVNRLAQDNPKLLNVLQDMAKDAADDGTYITVFVTSEGKAPIQMLSRSSSSRLGKVMEIGDLNHEEAIDFLCNKRGISKSTSQEIYGLVGGRLGLLGSTINELHSGQNFTDVRTLLLTDAKKVLRNAGMDQKAQFEPIAKPIAQFILKHGRISLDDFYKIAGAQGDKLLSIDVFTNVPRTEWVFFDTRPMEIAVGALVGEAAG
ncbi:P-loop containing nucleoside triphosphate hydrolase protein [Tuber borchii]|uniref:P-loop containing nucleoside triphosphate hydrolase protein n=1 Tax=Tuber borchii TaxID=42251 RepID=A0A2T6ZX60_TUBBO|nr:P-loop containing nucleoside triphosphate hydrolase protein [Tuber borchii]